MSRVVARAKVLSCLPYAFLATAAVFGVPAATSGALLLLNDPDPAPLAVAAASFVMWAVVTTGGSALWNRNPSSVEVSFGELMLWAWWRRYSSEKSIEESARLLGLKPDGMPQDRTRAPSLVDHLQLLHNLSEALEAKDPYTLGHSNRVERVAYRIGLGMGLSTPELEELRRAAALHDVGKIRVPDTILRKPGKLTDEEYEVIKEHSVVGAWMVSVLGNPVLVDAIRYHHERWDGEGYPDGRSGENIPLFARIIAVADTYDAITSTRPYRERGPRSRAVRIIEEESGRQFDPAVVDVFLAEMPSLKPAAASLLLLAEGPLRLTRRAAVVLKQVGATSVAQGLGAVGVTVAVSSTIIAPTFSATTGPKEISSAPASGASAGSGEGTTSPAVGASDDDEREEARGMGPAPERRAVDDEDTTDDEELSTSGELADDEDPGDETGVTEASPVGSGLDPVLVGAAPPGSSASSDNANPAGKGKSGSAPGKTGDLPGKSGGRGKSATAPGKSGDKGPAVPGGPSGAPGNAGDKGPPGSAPGNSGSAPGKGDGTSDTPGSSPGKETPPGNSGSAPGKGDGTSDTPGSSPGKEPLPGNSGNAPGSGNSGSAPGNSGGSSGSGGGGAGKSGSDSGSGGPSGASGNASDKP